MTTNVAMNGKITEAVEVGGDNGGCADFLTREFWIAVDAFVDFFIMEERRTISVYDGLFVHD